MKTDYTITVGPWLYYNRQGIPYLTPRVMLVYILYSKQQLPNENTTIYDRG